MDLITIFLDIDGVLNTPSEFGKRLNKNNVIVFNNLILRLEKTCEVQVVLSSSWRLSSGVNRILRDAGITAKLKGVTTNLGDRNKEINLHIKNNNLNPKHCISLDDEKDLVEKTMGIYYITNYKTGITEKDIDKIISKIK